MTISIVVCTDLNGGIGANNRLLTRLPSDLAHFKNLTDGNICIMGRKTFDSIIAKNGEPLPNRRSLVLSSNSDHKYTKHEAVSFYSDIDELVEDVKRASTSGEVFICGGESVYREFLPLANRIYLTTIKAEFADADTFFPVNYIGVGFGWQLAEASAVKDESGFDLIFSTYERGV